LVLVCLGLVCCGVWCLVFGVCVGRDRSSSRFSLPPNTRNTTTYDRCGSQHPKHTQPPTTTTNHHQHGRNRCGSTPRSARTGGTPWGTPRPTSRSYYPGMMRWSGRRLGCVCVEWGFGWCGVLFVGGVGALVVGVVCLRCLGRWLVAALRGSFGF
jgi:hypothetical protein